MKSRSLLLAAMLFAVPAFADNTENPVQPKVENQDAQVKPDATPAPEASKTPETTEKTEEKKDSTPVATTEEVSTFAKIRGYAAAPFVFALATAPDWVAKKTLVRLAEMEYLKGGNIAKFFSNEWTGRVTVYGAAAIVAYVIYKNAFANDADDVDTDEEEIFNN